MQTIQYGPRVKALWPELPLYKGKAEDHPVGSLVRMDEPTPSLLYISRTPDGAPSADSVITPEDLERAIVRARIHAPWPTRDRPDFHPRLQRLTLDLAGLVPPPTERLDPLACQRPMGRISLEPHQHMVSLPLAYGPYRGLVAVHSLGSGKTCTAIATMNDFLRARDSHTPPDEPSVLFVIPPRDALVENLREQIGRCPGFLRDRIETERLDGPMRSALINRHVQVLTYVALANRLAKNEIRLAGKLVILDEAHNLLASDLPQFRTHYEAVYRALRSEPNVKLLLMTATPFVHGFHDLCRLVNLCLAPHEADLPTTPKAFQDRYVAPDGITLLPNLALDLQGLVSWFFQEEDRSFFARKSYLPPRILPVTLDHFERWQEAAAKERAIYGVRELTDFAALEQTTGFTEGPRKLFKGSSEACNYPHRVYKSKGLWTPKFEEVHRAFLRASHEKHVVFSRHLEAGVRALAAYLEKKGWTRMSNNRSDAVATPPKTYHPLVDQWEAFGRSASNQEAAQLRQKAMDALPITHRGFLVLTKDTPDRDIRRARALFNAPENREGRIVHAILLDETFFEGVSLLSTNHVHLLEPIPHPKSKRQAVARAVRRCSHTGQPWPWTVNVHCYIHAYVDETGKMHPMTDHFMLAYNERIQRQFDGVYDALQQASLEHEWRAPLDTEEIRRVQTRLGHAQRLQDALRRPLRRRAWEMQEEASLPVHKNK